jgi:hypothetical protein
LTVCPEKNPICQCPLINSQIEPGRRTAARDPVLRSNPASNGRFAEARVRRSRDEKGELGDGAVCHLQKFAMGIGLPFPS